MKYITAFCYSFFICLALSAQPVLVDRGVQANGLWCFPIYENEDTYLYLPARSRLAMNEDSLPTFSFMRYVLEKPSEGPSTSTITEADGGGILHFLILYDTPEEMVTKAQATLRERLDNDEITIRGPVVFEQARYALVSSILTDKGEQENKLIGTGEAPVLENSRIALSFDVDPVKSKILLESFKMATPDVSLVFELSFSGYTDSYEAELLINWDEVKKSQNFKAGGSVYFVSAEVELGLDELRKNQAIKLNTVGDDDKMDALVQVVYEKLLKLMFEPVKPETIPAGEAGGLNDAIASLIGSGGAMSSQNTTGFGLGVGYRMKQMNVSGDAKLHFNGRSTVSRKHYVTFNAGNLYQKYGDNELIFKDVPLWDPAFQQRDVYVGIDGELEKEFDRMINSVTVKMKKDHADSSTTAREVMISKEQFKENQGTVTMTYLNKKDEDLEKWLEYRFQTVWKFIGGGTLATDWEPSAAAMINLYTPFKRLKIELDGDMDMLKAEGVRAVSIKISYPFFDQIKEESLRIRPGDDLTQKFFEITLPINEEEVNYTINWFKEDRTRLTVEGVDKFGLIFIDELPQ